jgi:hypothetical protein
VIQRVSPLQALAQIVLRDHRGLDDRQAGLQALMGCALRLRGSTPVALATRRTFNSGGCHHIYCLSNCYSGTGCVRRIWRLRVRLYTRKHPDAQPVHLARSTGGWSVMRPSRSTRRALLLVASTYASAVAILRRILSFEARRPVDLRGGHDPRIRREPLRHARADDQRERGAGHRYLRISSSMRQRPRR